MIDISCTGTDTTKYFFAYYADKDPFRVGRLVLGPNADLAASGTNYITVSLSKFNVGTETGIAFDEGMPSFSTDATRGLSQGAPVLLPSIGDMDVLVRKEESLYVKVVITGTVTLNAHAQLERRRHA